MILDQVYDYHIIIYNSPCVVCNHIIGRRCLLNMTDPSVNKSMSSVSTMKMKHKNDQSPIEKVILYSLNNLRRG